MGQPIYKDLKLFCTKMENSFEYKKTSRNIKPFSTMFSLDRCVQD